MCEGPVLKIPARSNG